MSDCQSLLERLRLVRRRIDFAEAERRCFQAYIRAWIAQDREKCGIVVGPTTHPGRQLKREQMLSVPAADQWPLPKSRHWLAERWNHKIPVGQRTRHVRIGIRCTPNSRL